MSTISSIGRLINVLDHLRKLDEQAFTPLLISIGPIHRSNPKLQIMNKCKERFYDYFIRRANINLHDLERTIREKEGEFRSYYAQTIVSHIERVDFVTMILTNGLFILEYYLRKSCPHLEEDDPTRILEWMHPILKVDLVLLENLLPFFVLEMLFEKATSGDKWAELQLKPLSLKELAFEFFQFYNFQNMLPRNSDVEIGHFTDLVRWFHLGECELKEIFGGAKLSYSAIQQHEAGVSNRHFLDIKFNN